MHGPKHNDMQQKYFFSRNQNATVSGNGILRALSPAPPAHPPKNALCAFLALSELNASSLTATRQHSTGALPFLTP